MPVSTAIVWLKVASAILLIGFGLLFAAAAHPPLSGLVTWLIDIVIWPMDGAQSLVAQETRLVLAIGGGITLGWGVMVWLLASHLMPVNPLLARQIMLRSFLAWFVVDSICSWLAGVPLNIFANVGFLAAFLYPLLRIDQRALTTAS